MKELKIIQAEAIAAAFNDLNPIGTKVILINDMGEREKMKIRSESWVLGHGEPVVSVEGRAGGYILSHIISGPLLG